MQNCYTRCKPPSQFPDKDERLTTNHVKALTFLQELGKENKELKAKIMQLEVCLFVYQIIFVFSIYYQY